VLLAASMSPLTTAIAGENLPEAANVGTGWDMSNFLLRGNGVLPVPIFITEPAIGYGLGVALLHFSLPDNADDNQPPAAGDKTSRPNITGIAGFATGTHSWGAAALHTHSWDNDRIRYTGVIGKINLHLTYYGVQQQSRSYLLDGFAMFHELLFRVGDSRWYVGPRYSFFDSHTRFDFGIPTDHGNFVAEQRVAKGGLVTSYDSRDNNFYPSSGTYAQFVAEFARGGLGSTSDFEVQSAKAFHWMPIGERWVLGLRADSGFSQGDIPFFAQPFVILRGVPAAKYQDRNQLTIEAELRWNATPDWSVLGFAGVGRAYGNLHSFSDAPVAYGFGAGFRYLLVRKIGLTMGIDIARGPGQNAFYIQIGSPWR
jgi:hypothetical protein